MQKADKGVLRVSSILTVLVILVNLVPPLFTSIGLWPMFLAVIFFFLLANGELKKIPHILVSGFVGIALTTLMLYCVGLLAPSIGATAATWICLPVVLIIIIIGGNWLPFALNNIAFAYMLVASNEFTSGMIINALQGQLGMEIEPYNLFATAGTWLGIMFVCGTLMCCTCGIIMKTVLGAWAKKNAAKQGAQE